MPTRIINLLLSLFLALTLLALASAAFALGEAGGSTTTKYYKDLYANSCSKEKTGFCSAKFSTYVDSPTRKYSQTGCELSTVYPLDQVMLKYKMQNYVLNNGQYVLNSTINGSDPVAQEKSLTCTAPAVFKLEGCTATCELPPPDPCAPLAGLKFSKIVSCGNVICPNGGVLTGNASGIICSKGTSSSVLAPDLTAVDPSNSCMGSDGVAPVPQIPKVKVSDIGKSTAPTYCSSTFTYTGFSANDSSPTPEDLAALSAIDAIPTTEDGTCPPEKPLKGQFGGGWACFPNDQPTDNPCPNAGEIMNNNGVCVPFADAGTCPNNATRDPVTGNCPSGEPDPNPDTGDGDNPDTDTGGGGGGGGGGSGGSGGSGDSGGDDSTSTPDSTKGAGGKTSASTAEGCTTAPPCSGDALACAAFIQDWKQNCQLMSISQADADKANELGKASNDEFKAAKTSKETQVTGFFSTFKSNATASLTSSHCPADLSLSVMGKSLVIPFSNSCDFWRLLRLLVIASAYLASASIVFRSFA